MTGFTQIFPIFRTNVLVPGSSNEFYQEKIKEEDMPEKGKSLNSENKF